ncbi:hypothetical protein HN858_02190 [Candidatus Falkowbacteria bacterium]|jgi:hypothetical protein|nr:hypothetical protein [Candidatus Falkowbacteria bacterium]MBT5502806.1 hypothetical protein [Candidatus Falkowbacteria bacterium]MBT6573423.1 hypothetical protein [Candidatus Falkowbacteria bacterium]MBT7348465.1 hypothetical protein [Candidatus Falkowbacteria bacterium]MBT7501191.1 hypothetical protein [Candidatus Falkowbacteria bacterium]
MKINLNKLLQITKIVVTAGLLILFLFLIYQKLVPNNSLTYNYNFSGQERFIQGFYPEGRVAQYDDLQRIIFEPVYLDVYSPRTFKKAKVILRYYRPYDVQAKFGLKLVQNDWAFYFEELPETPDGYIDYEMEFDLTNAERIKNKYKFILAFQELGITNEKVLVDSIKITLEK